jgi:hypothetical protein
MTHTEPVVENCADNTRRSRRLLQEGWEAGLVASFFSVLGKLNPDRGSATGFEATKKTSVVFLR